MATRVAQYLYIYSALSVSIPETGATGLGAGKTLTGTFSSTRNGTPAQIGSLVQTDTAVGRAYALAFSRAGFITDLASYVGQRVWLVLDDGAALRDVWEFQVTDIDPDLMPALLA